MNTHPFKDHIGMGSIMATKANDFCFKTYSSFIFSWLLLFMMWKYLYFSFTFFYYMDNTFHFMLILCFFPEYKFDALHKDLPFNPFYFCFLSEQQEYLVKSILLQLR